MNKSNFGLGSDFGDSCRSAAHNMFLEFFAENGIISGLLFLYIIFKSLYYLQKYDKYVNDKGFGLGVSVSISLLALLFSGLFLSQGKNSVLWFMIGIGYCIENIRKTDRKNKYHSKHNYGIIS